ncbi:MAG: hypothetical protein ASARMPREDX12_008286 [Alectoria sarmentosa]|nr:MAG: hypothetical protein ASARMPREDX12_008286 [Alectoria sarmentosa]
MHLVKSLIVVTLATPFVVAGPRGNGLRRRAGGDNKDSNSSSLPTIGLTPSSSTPANGQPSLISVGTAPLGTGISSAPETTEEVVLTDVVYTTLTTCPVTSLVTSGSTSFEEITTTISTVTRTSTSTLCTKCVAPPSKPALSSSSPGETAVSSLQSSIVYSLPQPSLVLLSISTSSRAETLGTGGLSAILSTNTIPIIPLQTGISSRPEVPGTAAPSSSVVGFPSFVSLIASATAGVSSTLEFPGYGIVPSPINAPGSPREEIISNATSSIIPVYTAALLGNAYGGGFISTPSVYVTKLPYPNGPSSGIPPGYGSESSITIIENNVTAVYTGLEASSNSAPGPESTTGIESPTLATTITSNGSVLISNLGASTSAPPGPESMTGIESLTLATTITSNGSVLISSLGASTSAPGPQSTTGIGLPAFTATIASNVSILFGSLGASIISATISESEGSTPTFVSLSPFGGEVGQESGSIAVPNVVSIEVPSSLGVGMEASVASSATATAQTGNSGSGSANVVTALIAATSPAGALSAEVNQVSNAVLSSLAAAGLPTSSVNVQVAVVGSSTTLIVDSSGAAAVSSFPISTLIGGVVNLSSVATVFPLDVGSPTSTLIEGTANLSPVATVLGAGPSSFPISTPIEGAAILSPVVTVSPLGVGSPTSTLIGGVAILSPVVTVPSLSAGSPTSAPIGGAALLSAVTTVPLLGAGSSSFPTSVLIGGAAVVSTVATASPPGAGLSSFQAITEAEIAGTSATSAIGFAGVIEASVVPATTIAGVALGLSFSSSGVNIEATLAGSPTSGEMGATIIPSLPAEQSAGPVVTLAVGSSAEQTPAAGQPAASIPTSIIVANGSTALAVIPSPVIGANGLTSLAIFSTPIAPAAGLTTPAVLLTPIVGPNGLTSLAVVATPIVGANGLTSLAIGFETETTPAAGQSNSAPSPVEGFVVIPPPAFIPQVSEGIPIQANIAGSGVANIGFPSGPAESPVSGGSGSGNYSIHVLLNPTAATQFQGSAVKIAFGFGLGLSGLLVFLVLL